MKLTMQIAPLRVDRKATGRAVVAAAVLALLCPLVAFGQQRVSNDGRLITGRANDASNRIGSNGYNGDFQTPTYGVFGASVVNGTITNGRAFRENVPSSDFAAFHSRSALPGSGVDSFAKNSTAAPLPNSPLTIPNSTETYYGLSRFTAPPTGFVQQINTPGYTPANAANSPFTQTANDTRLGNVSNSDTLPLSFYQKPIDLLVPGYDYNNSRPTIVAASPLYGVRSLDPTNPADLQFLNRFNGRPETAYDRLKLDPQMLNNARAELLLQKGGGAAVTEHPDPANLARPLVQPFESPVNGAIDSKPLDDSFKVKPLSGDVTANTAGTANKLLTPGQQSTQYADMKKRLERYDVLRKDTATASSIAFNAATKAKADAEGKALANLAGGNKPKTGLAGGLKPGELPVASNIPDTTGMKGTAEKIEPLTVPSLATGVNTKGLADMLKKAEGLMKEGKYTTAVDQYAAAEAVAPNQPLIWIGRANAELGASYYGRSEAHLKQAFQGDQALLMAKYDLKAFLGEDRLDAVTRDLKEMAATNPNSATAVFLLAYIEYNSGSQSKAAGYLDLADKRTGGKEPIFTTLRDHWSLEKDTAPSPLEKK